MERAPETAAEMLELASHLRPIRYWFYFDTGIGAELATATIRPLVDFVAIRRAADGRKWLLFAIIREDANPESRREQWTQIAEQVRGEYDGWDANEPPSFAELVSESIGEAVQ